MTQTSGAGFSADKPFFRYDLQTEAVEDGGQRFVDVSDPNGGASFRFFEVEYAVACGMDGERDLDSLVKWAKTELDLKTTTAELGAIVSKLGELRYLSGAVAAPVVADSVPVPVVDDEVAAMPEMVATPPRVDQDSGIDVELGNSGKSPLRGARPEAPSAAADLELGVAGVGEAAAPKVTAAQDDGMVLGAAGNEDAIDEAEEVTIAGPSREVSTDLSQTFRIDKDEVKAAVRASKVMSAVEVPEELEDELAAARNKAEEDAKAKAEEDAKAAAAIPENVPPSSDISDSIADEVSEEESRGGAAIVLPEAPAKVAAVAAADTGKKAGKKKQLGPKRNSASMVLWVVLLLVAAAGAGYYYMEYVREQPEEKGPAITPQQAAAARAQRKPEPPKAPSAALEVSEAPTAEVTVARAGVVAWVIEPSTDVAEGDEIVKLSGFERADKTIERHNKSLATYEAQLAALPAGSSRAASIEANVSRKKLDVELANEKRNAFIIRAPIAGVVETVVEVRGRVAASQVVGSITGSASATVTFSLPEGVAVAAEDELEVVSKDDAELKTTCEVTAADDGSVTLACPADSGLSDGANVELTLPKAGAAKPAAPDAPAPDEAAAPDAADPETAAPDAPAPEAAAGQ